MRKNYFFRIFLLGIFILGIGIVKINAQVVQSPLPSSSYFYDFTGNGEKGFINSYGIGGNPLGIYSFKSISNNFELWNLLYQGTFNDIFSGKNKYIIDDVNRDGIPDIGLKSNDTQSWGKKDSLLLSRSDGSYKKIQALLCRNADINADGKIDLFENIDNKYNYTLTQQPNGSFLRRFLQTLTFDEYYADFDPTAWVEANSANYSGKLPPRGNGIRFSGVSLSHDNFESPKIQRPDVCLDINGDGIPDLLSIETGMVFYGTSNPEKYIITGVGNQIIAKELNNDGMIDYIIVDAANNRVKTLVYQGNNEYKEQVLINEMTVDKNVYCYDFDRDGYVDILVTSSYHKNKMGYFLISCKNDGKGNFTMSEDAIPGKWAIAGCQDIDNDGFYDVLLADITDENYYSGKEIDVYVRKGKAGFAFNIIEKLYRANENYINNGTVITSEELDFGLNVEDIDNDGYMEVWLVDDAYLHKISSSNRNTAPNKPAKPAVLFDAGTGKLQINWNKGSDTQSSSCDLTYALRIGTAPGKGDIVYAHANADGKRRNFHEGNAGYNLSKAFDARTWLPGTYYVSLQVIDPQHTGSTWSDEVSFVHNFAASNFAVSKNTLNFSDTLKVFYSEIPGYNYQWTSDGASKLSSSLPGELHLTWNQGGTKTLALQIELPDGSLTEKIEETITVLDNRIGFLEPMSGTEYNYNHTLSNILTGIFADWNMDGKQDVVTASDGLYKNDGAGKFTKLMKGFNTTFTPSYGKWLDWNMDGVADLFYVNSDKSGNLTYGCLLNNLNDNFTKTDLSLQTDAYDNGGSLSRIFSMADMDNDGDLDPLTLQYRYFEGKQEQGLYKNDGNSVFSFAAKYPFDETAKIADWNKDGFFDLYTPLFKGDYMTNYYYYYSGMQILENKGNYDFEKKVIPFENTITNGVRNHYGQIKFFACDFDNDGYIDLFFFKNEKVAHILRNESNLRFVKGWDVLIDENVSLITMSGGAPSKPVFDQNFLDIKVMDLDNNGYPDILFSATDKFKNPQEISDYINHYAPYVIYNDGNGVFRQGFIGNEEGNYLDKLGKNIVVDLDGDNIPDPVFGITSTSINNSTTYNVLAKVQTNITNTCPQAPAGVVATQTENSLIIEWDDAIDKETPATQMRYNLSVKKKGATGPGSYIISPLNGGNAQMAALSPVQIANYYDENPGHYYIEATRFEIPLSALPLGEVEISVQAIDLWNNMSEFSAVYTKKIENSVKLKTPATVCFDAPAEIVYNGPQGSGQVDWNFDSGQIVSGSGWGPYLVKWNTSGVKNISLTIAGETATTQIKVLSDYSAVFGLADNIFYDTEMEITLPEVAQNAIFRWELSNNSSNFLEHWISARPGNKTGIIKITGGGLRYRELTLTVFQNGCEKTYKKSLNVVEKINPPAISLVYPNASNKNVITWDVANLPANSSEIIVYKEGSYLNDFREIGRVPASQLQFTDVSSNTMVKSERYAIAAVLNSGMFSGKSEIHQTLHLTINKGIVDGQWNLIWSAYKGRDIATYRILRGATPESLHLLAEISGAQLSYSDIANANEPYYALEYIPAPLLRSSGLKAAKEDDSARSNVVYSGDARSIVYMNNLNIMCVESNPVLSQEQQSLYLYAEIFPLNTTYQNIVWSIEEGSNLATIDQTGQLKGMSNATGGIVTVKATAIDGSQTVATRSFTVGAISGETSIPESPVVKEHKAPVIYPNPVKETLFIDYSNEIKNMIILNSSGVIVKKENQDIKEINVSSLPAGIYIIIIQTGEEYYRNKFIKN